MGARPFRLLTERLVLRDHVRSDFASYYGLFADPEVTEFTYDGLRADRRAQRREFKEVLAQRALALRDEYYLVAEDRADGSYVGECGFDIRRREARGGIAEAGYFLVRGRWGAGYGTEILSAIVRYCFDALRLHKVVATCDARNARSQRVILKCGLALEGTLRRQRYVAPRGEVRGDRPAGRWVDELLYGIVNERFFEGDLPS